MHARIGLALTTVLLLASTALAADKLSPFTAVEFADDTPFVRYDGEWYELLELEGMSAEEIVGFCRKTWGGRWEKRFAEDLVEVLEKMGKRPGRSVKLVLKSKETGKTRRVARARMTEENRRAVWQAREDAEPAATPEQLTSTEAASDLRILRDHLAQHHSYHLRFPGFLDRFKWMGGKIPTKDFAVVVARMLAPLGDGHTRVRGRWDWLPKGYAPFRVAVAGERFVALDLSGDRFLVEGLPYLRAIDGKRVRKWIQATKGIVAHGSRQYRLWTGAEYVQFVAYLRGELGIEPAPTVRVEVESDDGLKSKTVELPLADRAPGPARLPARPDSVKEHGIWYLKVAEMTSDERHLTAIRDAMRTYRERRGLILDVRGNGGGSRDVLRTILPHFLEEPRVVNVAKYRLPDAERPEDPQGHLENRFLYPLAWKGWKGGDKRLLKKFAKEFRPKWRPPAGLFSEWHYMLVKPAAKADRLEMPVVILMDANCFSATDIFLAAFKGVPGVTLLGVASGGGSGRSTKLTLPKSGLRLRVSTMASFQPNGRLYDGNGIAPDIVVEPTPDDWIGKTDTMLDAAVKRILAASE